MKFCQLLILVFDIIFYLLNSRHLATIIINNFDKYYLSSS